MVPANLPSPLSFMNLLQATSSVVPIQEMVKDIRHYEGAQALPRFGSIWQSSTTCLIDRRLKTKAISSDVSGLQTGAGTRFYRRAERPGFRKACSP